MKTHLNQLIKQNGIKKIFNKGDIVFSSLEEDYNLYYIEIGNILLIKNGKLVIDLGEGELIGEKSFIEKKSKSVDAKCNQDNTEVYFISPNIFEKFDINLKEDFYKILILILSKRIYKLNDILMLIENINNEMIKYGENNFNDILNNIFINLIDLQGYIIFKYEFAQIAKIKANNISIDIDLIGFLEDLISSGVNQKIGKNYIYIKTDIYYYFLIGKPKLDNYILSNTIIYTNALFRYLGENTENELKKEFLKTLDN